MSNPVAFRRLGVKRSGSGGFAFRLGLEGRHFRCPAMRQRPLPQIPSVPALDNLQELRSRPCGFPAASLLFSLGSYLAFENMERYLLKTAPRPKGSTAVLQKQNFLKNSFPYNRNVIQSVYIQKYPKHAPFVIIKIAYVIQQ